MKITTSGDKAGAACVEIRHVVVDEEGGPYLWIYDFRQIDDGTWDCCLLSAECDKTGDPNWPPGLFARKQVPTLFDALTWATR